MPGLHFRESHPESCGSNPGVLEWVEYLGVLNSLARAGQQWGTMGEISKDSARRLLLATPQLSWSRLMRYEPLIIWMTNLECKIPVLSILLSLAVLRGPASAGQTAPNAAAPAVPPAFDSKPVSASLPRGTVLFLRLDSLVSTKASHLNEPVTARVVREASLGEGVAIALGALVKGRIEKLIPSSSPTDRARMLLRFTRLEIGGQPPVAVAGHVVEVENAREEVLVRGTTQGTIQGVLASELPTMGIDTALAKLGKSNPDLAAEIQKQKEKNLGKADTSIELPAGTDLQFVLDKALPVERVFPPAVSDQLPSDLAVRLDQLLADAPQRSSSKEGKLGDPLNLVLIGSAEEIRQAFQQGGWMEAEQRTSKSVWQTVRAVIGDQGYGAAPVSHLYLFGRPEDLAFEKILDTFAKRHHLRLWRSSARTSEGREIWLGAATHDVGIDAHLSHAIDPILDAERAKVGADLLVTGRVVAQHLVTPPNPLRQGFTVTGSPWKTDGQLLAIDLKN